MMFCCAGVLVYNTSQSTWKCGEGKGVIGLCGLEKTKEENSFWAWGQEDGVSKIKN